MWSKMRWTTEWLSSKRSIAATLYQRGRVRQGFLDAHHLDRCIDESTAIEHHTPVFGEARAVVGEHAKRALAIARRAADCREEAVRAGTRGACCRSNASRSHRSP